jgi:predicted nucleic acid-binding protein
MGSDLVLIDTSVWIMALGKSAPPELKAEVSHLLAEDMVAIDSMIRLELLGGTKSLDEFNRLQSRLSALHQVPKDEANWETAIQLAFQLRRGGKMIPYTDILIASAAITNDCTLLHSDRHFDVIAEASHLKVKSLVSIAGE